MLRQEARQVRNDLADPEGAGHGDPEHPLQAVDTAGRVLGLAEIAQDLAHALQEHGAGIGRGDLAGRAQEKPDTQPRLEAGHHARHRGLGQAELASDAGEAAPLRGAHEDGQLPQSVIHTQCV